MATPTTPTAQELIAPSGTEIYDAIMSRIEPELITSNIPLLDAQYKNESPADRQKRLKRYQIAFRKYDADYATWHSELSNTVNEFRRDSLRSAETREREKETAALQDIEAQINLQLLPNAA